MNYERLTVDELAARTVVDAGARGYAGDHFLAIVERLEDESREQFMADFDEAVDQAAGALFDQRCNAMTWRPLSSDSPWWRIG